ncbi:MAG: hypothetical protein IJ302_06290, partial [Clostridia bacterium]|nr:hypothetical protein [Clostridia bacterium]
MEESQTIYDTAEYLAGDSEFIVPADFHDDFRNGTLRLQRVVITGLPGWVRLKRALGDFTPVGYPNREGKHYASIQGTVLFAASSQTEYREEVCTFLSLWFARNTASMYDST